MKKVAGRAQGMFTSPNFPRVYVTGINCILYTFIGLPGEIVELTFLEFDMQLPITNRYTRENNFFDESTQRAAGIYITPLRYRRCACSEVGTMTPHRSNHRSICDQFSAGSRLIPYEQTEVICSILMVIYLFVLSLFIAGATIFCESFSTWRNRKWTSSISGTTNCAATSRWSRSSTIRRRALSYSSSIRTSSRATTPASGASTNF